MKILLVAATKFEIASLLKVMGQAEPTDEKFVSVVYKNNEIDFLITGVGMVATTYYTSKALVKKYDLALNIGICGSFNKNLEPGSVVHIYKDCFSELGAEDGEEFLTLEEINLKGETEILNDTPISNSILKDLPKVTGITVNTVHGNKQNIEKVFNKFHPFVESMEGAAFMFVCKNEQVPYAQIRAVSNFVEARNKNNWNIPLALENLNKKVLEILEAF